MDRNQNIVALAGEEKIGPEVDGDGAGHVGKKDQRDQQPDVEQLIGAHHSIKTAADRTRTVAPAQSDDPHVVGEQTPDDDRVKRRQDEPGERVVEMGEGERLDQGAGDVEKVVDELERPSNQRQGVDEGPGPEEQNDDEPGGDIGPGRRLSHGKNLPGIIDQEIERDALDDAAKGQLDLDHHRVEFFSATAGRSHDGSGIRFRGRMSISAHNFAATVTFRRNSAEILPAIRPAKPI